MTTLSCLPRSMLVLTIPSSDDAELGSLIVVDGYSYFVVLRIGRYVMCLHARGVLNSQFESWCSHFNLQSVHAGSNNDFL